MNVSGSRRRRLFRGALVAGAVPGTVISSIPSTLDTGLLDVTIANEAREPRPTGSRGVLDLWSSGQPTTLSLWASYDRVLRHEWAGVVLAHRRRDDPEQPAGTAFYLDGRFVTDIEGFYCAIGGAINGPGGYFGSNLDRRLPTGALRLRLDWSGRTRWGPAIISSSDTTGIDTRRRSLSTLFGDAHRTRYRGRPALKASARHRSIPALAPRDNTRAIAAFRVGGPAHTPGRHSWWMFLLSEWKSPAAVLKPSPPEPSALPRPQPSAGTLLC